jgi:hypothetical protein
MAHYYFDVLNGTGLTIDDEGQDFAGDRDARAQAIESIRSIVSEEARHGQINLNGVVSVRDENRDLMFTVQFDDAIELILPPRLPSP